MPVINRIADLADEMTEWRQHLHRHPELKFDLHQTAAFVATALREIRRGRDPRGHRQDRHRGDHPRAGAPGPTIGLRADMDALPITEERPGRTMRRRRPAGCMPAAMTGIRRCCSARRNIWPRRGDFAGRVALIFQPAEEDGGGGEVMVQEGVMDRFGIAQVYGIHNAPNLPFGTFHTRPGR